MHGTQTLATLILIKRGYSRAPWRIEVQRADGQCISIPYCWFDRKRDGLPFLQRLQALEGIAWEAETDTWPEAHLAAVRAIIHEMPGYQADVALKARGPVAAR